MLLEDEIGGNRLGEILVAVRVNGVEKREEINIEEQDDVTDDMMMLAYILEEGVVQEIWIYDMRFGKTFK